MHPRDRPGPYREIGIVLPQIHASRVFTSAEISDGRLRLVALPAALLDESAPSLIVLNEPEASLHSSTYSALAEAIDIAAMRTQIIVVSHSVKLAKATRARRAAKVRRLRWDAERGTRMDNQTPSHDSNVISPLSSVLRGEGVEG
jgi:predicted ATPase